MAILYETPTVPSEFTNLVTQGVSPAVSGTVIFTDLDPNYAYELYYYSPDSQYNSLSIPKWTYVTKELVYNSTLGRNTMNLTYGISGGTDGSSQFVLKQLAN